MIKLSIFGTLNFSDPEINDECVSVCRLDYISCRQNCDSNPACESTCSAIFAGNLTIPNFNTDF